MSCLLIGKGHIMSIAIVAGAGTGLGQSTALVLHGAGVTVVAVDRNEAGLKQLPNEVHREVADATDPAVPGPLVDRIAAEIGPPDILVNTIGAFEVGDALAVTPQKLRQLMDVNLGAALWLTQAVVPHMQQRGSGVIVHVASRPGLEPTAGFAAYSVTKAALVHLVRTLDVELRPQGIRVNAVAPQLLATEKQGALPAGGADRRRRAASCRRGDRLPGQRQSRARERGHCAGLRRMMYKIGERQLAPGPSEGPGHPRARHV
jgi:NAD(P)-dependent dehydrogenase (short-subunit alcohol dehydrogenase family)